MAAIWRTTVADAERIVIIGAGGFGREVLQWLRDSCAGGKRLEFVGFLDDAPREAWSKMGKPIVGQVEAVADFQGVKFVVAVNAPVARQRLVERVNLPDERWADVVHPTATVGSGVRVGPGLVLCPYSGMSVDIQIGRHFQLNSRSGIGHDVVIGDFGTVGPNSNVLGNVRAGHRLNMGANAAILPGAMLGDDITVGAGATAMRRIPSGTVVYGSPGRRL